MTRRGLLMTLAALPVLDGSFYDGSVPTGMTLFQPGSFDITATTTDSLGNWDAAVSATVTLDYAFAIWAIQGGRQEGEDVR